MQLTIKNTAAATYDDNDESDDDDGDSKSGIIPDKMLNSLRGEARGCCGITYPIAKVMRGAPR